MEEKLLQIAENSIALHEKCVEKHFVTSVAGSGSDVLSFHLPFEPDCLLVVCTDPQILSVTNTMLSFMADFSSLGYITAVFNSSSGGSLFNMAMTNTSMYSRYSRTPEGLCTLQNFVNKGASCLFREQLQYQVVAVKFKLPSDRERIYDLVENLTGSGTMKIWGEKLHNALTDEEWAALKATKPNWTFEEV